MMKFDPPKLFRWIVAAAAVVLMSEPAVAEKRVALVVGNSAYQNVSSLANAVNDSTKIAAMLKSADFNIVEARRDLSFVEMRRTLRDFADRARDADIAVVYYAGHGIEVDGANYLIPIDAKLERDTDVYDEAFSLDRVLIAIEPAKKLRLVILDACRDNPFARSMKRTVATRAIGQGLAKVEPASPNVLIAYSAKAGSTAADGDGQNSPFTTALSHHLTKPGLDVRRAFGFVRDEVLQVTNSRQEPFVYGSLGGEDIPLVPIARQPSVSPPDPALSARSEARRDYDLAMQIGNKSALEAFLAQHPDGFYANLAKLQIEKITADEALVTAKEKARLAEQERGRLAAEGAQKAKQAKAEADTKAAEQARVAAELAKQAAQDKAAAAEQTRVADDKAVNVAALTSGGQQAGITKSVQTELRRVGCMAVDADGNWNNASQQSLTRFNLYAGTNLDTKIASVDTLDTIKLKTSRVCPLVCKKGFHAEGERCIKITCPNGSFLNDDDKCTKQSVRRQDAKRNINNRNDHIAPLRDRQQSGIQGALSKPRLSAGAAGESRQIVCDARDCRPVRRGCRIDYQGGSPRDGSGGNVEVCN